MKVVQVSAYYPPHLGGQENAVQSLATQLASRGHHVQVVASAQGAQKGSAIEHAVQVHRLPSIVFGHAPIMPRFLGTLRQAVRPGSIVHIHIGQAFTPEMVWLGSKLFGFKYIAQLHIDFEPSGPAGLLLPLYKKLLLKHALRGASAVIVLNEKTLQMVRHSYGYTGPLQIINNGIDDVHFNPKRPPLTAKPPTTLKLLFVGRLSKQKNLAELLRALTLTNRTVQLAIIGEGPEQDALREIAASNKLKNVTFYGRLPREKVKQFYKKSDALIIPSLYEAQPLVLLEAMAAKIPIIGTNVIGVAEHIGDGGIITEPNAQSIANGIDRFYTQYPHIEDMVEKSYAKARGMRWPQTLANYEALYEEVLAA